MASIEELGPHSQQCAPSRKTIAVLLDRVESLAAGYQAQLRLGFERACQTHDTNLLFVVGRALETPDPVSAAHNHVYELLQGGGIDGVVLLSAELGAASGTLQLVQLCESLRPAAVCSVGVIVPGVPSIVIENHFGMAAVLEHLVDVHNCRRIAFVGGPQKNADAAARLQVYRQVLAMYNLPFNSNLVALGDFTFQAGMLATNILLECGDKFDAIVAGNDDMALGAIEALRQHRLRVPRDVRVVGFDDIADARFSNPPLTTLRQPLEKMASLAIGRVVEQLEGQCVDAVTRLPVEIVARRSCGCLYRKGRHSIPCPPPEESRTGRLSHAQADQLARDIDQVLAQSGIATLTTGRDFVQAVLGEFTGKPSGFSALLESILETPNGRDEFYDDVQTVVTLLRDEFNQVGAAQYSDLWDAARRTIAMANVRSHTATRSRIELTYQNLLRCSERLGSVPDLSVLKRVLAEELPLVPVNDIIVSVGQPDPDRGKSALFGLIEGRAFDWTDAGFDQNQVIHLTHQVFEGRHSCVLLPLTFEGKYLGAVVFGMSTGLSVGSLLREQLSTALNTIALHKELARRTASQERSAQEQVAVSARIETLSVIAGSVAHDLNSAMSPLVALPDAMWNLIHQMGLADCPQGQRLHSYVVTMKVAASRATETIRDLMTLGRQGRTAKTTIDLNWLTAGCVSAEPSLAVLSDERQVAIELELCETPLPISASQYHVERAISNVIRNAVEAIGCSGKLTIRTQLAELNEPQLGLETIAPGQYGLLTITDTGPGIPQELLTKVFEPFFTNKQLHGSSGSGLGLAIVHGVVKEHEGYVDVASECGRGTTFSLYFPLVSSMLDRSSGTKTSASPLENSQEASAAPPSNRIDAA